MVVIDSSDVVPQPWRNGKGTTRKLWAEPGGPEARWRLSLADLTEDGPFSRFDGYERIFTPVVGGGFELTIDGRAHAAQTHRPMRFPGEADTAVHQLTAPARALNLMTARDRCDGAVHVRWHHGRISWGTDVRALVLLRGTLTIHEAELSPLGVAISTGEALTGRGDGALIAEVHLLDHGAR